MFQRVQYSFFVTTSVRHFHNDLVSSSICYPICVLWYPVFFITMVSLKIGDLVFKILSFNIRTFVQVCSYPSGFKDGMITQSNLSTILLTDESCPYLESIWKTKEVSLSTLVNCGACLKKWCVLKMDFHER